MISFTVPAVPVAQPRQRHTRNGLNYTPAQHPVNVFKASCRLAAHSVHTAPPFRQAICLTLLFVLPRPAAMIWKTKPMPRVSHSKKPDLDNLTKAVMDALSQLVWADDSQVTRLSATKVIAAGDESPHVRIKVEMA